MSVLGKNLRPITFEITGLGLTYEAIQAAVSKVAEIEEAIAINAAAVTNITDGTMVLTGKTPYKIFVFTVTTVKATGAYTFELQEIAANVETATTL